MPIPGKIHVSKEFPLQIVDPDLGAGVLEIFGEEFIVDGVGTDHGVLSLRHDRLPVGALGGASVDGDQAAARCVEVGLEPKDGTIVIDELVLGIEVVEQLDDLRVRLAEVFVVEAVFGRCALLDGNDEVAAIVGDSGVES